MRDPCSPFAPTLNEISQARAAFFGDVQERAGCAGLSQQVRLDCALAAVWQAAREYQAAQAAPNARAALLEAVVAK